jgi:hypothetical protein
VLCTGQSYRGRLDWLGQSTACVECTDSLDSGMLLLMTKRLSDGLLKATRRRHYIRMLRISQALLMKDVCGMRGLALYGWMFYVSKFYEVVDTAIIVKGKRSSTLQTYHHAGARLGMWSGISYMSPPIWLWVEYNSGIHAMMVHPISNLNCSQALIHESSTFITPSQLFRFRFRKL